MDLKLDLFIINILIYNHFSATYHQDISKHVNVFICSVVIIIRD